MCEREETAEFSEQAADKIHTHSCTYLPFSSFEFIPFGIFCSFFSFPSTGFLFYLIFSLFFCVWVISFVCYWIETERKELNFYRHKKRSKGFCHSRAFILRGNNNKYVGKLCVANTSTAFNLFSKYCFSFLPQRQNQYIIEFIGSRNKFVIASFSSSVNLLIFRQTRPTE